MTRPLPEPSEGPSLAWRSLASKLPEIQARDSASLGAMRQRVPVLLPSQDPGYGTWPMYRPPQACPTNKEKRLNYRIRRPALTCSVCKQAGSVLWRRLLQRPRAGASASSSATAASHCDEAHFQFRLPLHFGPHRQQCVLTYRARYRHLPAFSAAATSTPALDDACLKRTGDAPGRLLSHRDTISTSLSRRLAAWPFWLTDSGLRTVALFAATTS